MGFLFAKVVCFYWPSDAFLHLHRWPSFICEGKKQNKKEAAQRNDHTRLSMNQLKSDNIKVPNMLFFKQVCCLPGAWFKALLCGSHLRQYFSVLFFSPSRFCSTQVHSLFCIKEKQIQLMSLPLVLACAFPSPVCTACSMLFCAQMNETGQARAEQHKSNSPPNAETPWSRKK